MTHRPGALDAEPRAGAGPWAEPACERVDAGVYRIPIPLPGDSLTAVNVYALPHGGRVTLIDAGWSFGTGLEALSEGLAHLDLELGDIERVLVTHMHRDHYTLGIRLRRLFGTRVLLGIGERDGIEWQVAGRSDGQLSLLRRWGAEELRPGLLAAPPQPASEYGLPDEWIEDSAELVVGERRLRSIPTPGHTRGHVVFADVEHGLLFAGDHVLPRITPSIGLEPLRADLPLEDYLASLRLMKELPDLQLLPAHGALGRQTHARVDELLAHHEARLAATAASLGSRRRTAFECACDLPWTRRGRSFGELGLHDQLMAVAETAAHLDVLVRDGVLTAVDLEGIRTYTSSGAQHAHRDD